ncbi:hypothetical protein C4J81_08200 [Deltaproteobacteria bacterium Smac51]|nr:hypothetical protein C4J81_08200 [Deltaproteobacteria bacterium Smac51]
MARPLTKTRNRRLRYLSLLAAAGLLTLNCASPAFGDNQTITDGGKVGDSPGSDGGVSIVGDQANSTVTWDDPTTNSISTDADGTGLVFSADSIGNVDLNLDDSGTYTIGQGGITNNNKSGTSTINIKIPGSTLEVNGDITGNNTGTLVITGTGDNLGHDATLDASDSDVTGRVNFEGNGGAGSNFNVNVESIGGNGTAIVETNSGAGSVTLNIGSGGLGTGGNTSLTLNDNTIATITGDIGSDQMVNEITLNNVSSLEQTTGKVVGALTITNKNITNDSVVLNTLGDANDTTGLTVGGGTVGGGTVNISEIVGDTSIDAAAADSGTIYLKDNSGSKDLGSASADSNITLGGNAAGGTLEVNVKDIVGSTDGKTSTTINIDTSKATLTSTNVAPVTKANLANVSGHVNVNLTGGSSNLLALGVLKAGAVLSADASTSTPVNGQGISLDSVEGGADSDSATTINLDEKTGLTATEMTTGGYYALNLNGTTNAQAATITTVGNTAEDTSLTMGGTNDQAVTTITTLTGGTTGTDKITTVNLDKAASMEVTNAVTGNVDIINNSTTTGAALLNEMGDGVLRGGGAGEIDVTKIDAANGLTIASVDDEQGAVVSVGSTASGNGIQSTSKVSLKNAVLKVAADNSGLGALGNNFSMDSTDGESRLTVADKDDPAQDTLTFNDAPTVTVGDGGNVRIETKSLIYNSVLKTATTDEATGVIDKDGAVYFNPADTKNNRMIFSSSDSTNTFNDGVEIDGGRFEFEGSTTFVASDTPAAGNYMKNSDIYFTGLDDTGVTKSDYTIDGTASENTIDATGTTLHLNKGVNIISTDKGSLENLKTVALGDEAETSVTFGADTVLTTQFLTTGHRAAGATSNQVATVSKLLIGSNKAGFTSGLQATSSVTLSDKILVTDGLTIQANGSNPVINIANTDGGFILADDTAAAGSSVTGGVAMVNIDKVYNSKGFNQIQLLGGAISSTALTNKIAEMVANLDIDTSNISGDIKAVMGEDGTISYRTSTVDNIGDYIPSYARPMWAAATQLSPELGLYIEEGADPSSTMASGTYNRELTQIMGNTMNSSLSLVQNGTTSAFSRLNATTPTIVGYKTAMAVSSPPPRSTEVAPAAPSSSIGVPIRANDIQFGSMAEDTPPPPTAPSSGSNDGRPNGMWITPSYSKMSVDGNYKKGYGDLDVKSFGMTFGYDQWVNENARLGAFFSYSHPELSTDYQDIDADDFQLGFYGQGILPNGVIMNAGFAMGWQDYSSKRKIRLSGISGYNQELKADYNGDSFSAALEFSRPFALENDMFLRPSISYAYQKVSLDEIKESSTVVDQARNLAQKISSTSFDTQLVRLGTDIGWVNPDNTLTVTGKAYWVANVGDTQPQGSAKFISAGDGALPFKVRGAEYNENMANLGFGLKFNPAGQDGLTISLDYDALLGSKASSHNVGLMIRYEF